MPFSRRVPYSQLADYFKLKNVDVGANFSELKEKEVKQIFHAFIALPEDKQTTIEVEFQDINAMACGGGIAALVDEAAFHADNVSGSF